MAEDSVVTSTRYQRVMDILDAAAGDSAADYGGHGRFWKLPLDAFLSVSVHGVRMIAPEEEAPSCCASHGDEEVAGKCRAARSGLIRGLRGEPPFEGSRFPRLPWGGKAVAPDDLQFIADWIDDGCPETGAEIGAYDVEGVRAETALVQLDVDTYAPSVQADESRGHHVYQGPTSAYEYRVGDVKQRMNIEYLSETQLAELRFAFRELYKLNKWPEDARNYNNVALAHQNHCQHGWERFLPWHRIYLYEFEQALQDHCPDVTMPYWDWTMKHYRPERPQDGTIIPRALKLFLTEESLNFLEDSGIPARPSLQDLVGVHFATQHRFFREVAKKIDAKYTRGACRERFIDALLASNALWYPLRYPSEYQSNAEPSTINEAIHYHYPTADDIRQILSLRNFRDFGGGSLYNDSFGFLDQNPHNTMHIWTGGMNPDAGGPGAMSDDRNKTVQVAGRRFHTREDLYSQPAVGDMFSNLTASYDPIFWPVHSNVDRLWWEWQQLHPHSEPADLDAVLTPWSYTIRETLDMHRFGYEYVKCTYMAPVGLEAPVGRFISKPIDVPDTVRASFSHAEVRLHRVPQLPRSGFIRVFLNLPDANAHTPLDDEHNYAGYVAIFGHGPCYGGPGHCDIPPPSRRRHDLRPRSHNTPRNHRVDVSECVRRLFAMGATSIQTTLVVIGADYREDDELLRLEGVSLNFLD